MDKTKTEGTSLDHRRPVSDTDRTSKGTEVPKSPQTLYIT